MGQLHGIKQLYSPPAEAAPGTTAKEATHRLKTKKCIGSVCFALVWFFFRS
jgi:hypothetical protein